MVNVKYTNSWVGLGVGKEGWGGGGRRQKQSCQYDSSAELATHQEKLTLSGTSHPKARASFNELPSSAAWCINFLGMQPTLTQVPPKPHLVPARTQLVRHSVDKQDFNALSKAQG